MFNNPRRYILAASVLAVLAPVASAEILDQFTFGTGGTSLLTPTTVGTGVTAGAISADAGVTLDLSNSQTPAPASAPWLRVVPVGANTTAAAAVTANADFKFTLSALPGFTLNLSSLTFDMMRGGGSTPRGYALRSSLDNFGTTISAGDATTQRPDFTNFSVNLSAATYQNLPTVTFKIFSYAPASGSSVEYDNITVNGSATFSGYTWQGTNGNWDTASNNWTGTGTTYVDNTAGSKVLFSDAGTTTNVNVAAVGLSPNLITFTNSTAKNYSFSGGDLNVATTLFKSGDGVTTFNDKVSAASVTADVGTLAVGATGRLTSSNISVSPTGTLTVANGGILNATGTLTVDGALTLNNATQSVATLNGAATGIVSTEGILEVTGSGTYAGQITGNGSLVKSTGGTLTLSGPSSYFGDTTVTGGALQLSNASAAGFGAIKVNGATLSLGANISNAITLTGATIGVSAGVTTFSDLTVVGTSTVNTFNPITGATPNDLIISGMLQGSGNINLVSINGNNPDGAAFRLRGPISTGANAYSGTLTVGQSGKLELQTTDETGSPMGTGKLVVTGGTTSTTAAGTYSIVNVRNNSLGNATLGNNVEVSGTGSTYFNMLGSAPTGSVVNFGDLKIGDGQAAATVSSTNASGPYTLAFSSVHLTGGNAAFTPQPVGNTSFLGTHGIKLGPITENVAGSGIIMNGASTLTLTGINTYTGPTIVNSGTLAVNGSISASAVALNAGTLKGTGTTGALNMAGGTLAPGDGFGVLNTGTLTFNGGTLSLEIGGNAVGSYDQLNVSGGLFLNALIGLTLDFSTYAPALGDRFVVINNDLNDAVSFGSNTARFSFGPTQLDEGTIFTATSGAFTQDFQITYAGGTNNNDVVLVAVPEPGTAASLLAGVGVLVGLRRRRR